MPQHTLAQIEKFVWYDEEIGRLRWKVRRWGYSGSYPAGSIVQGRVMVIKGRIARRVVGVDKESFYEHLLIWWIKTRRYPRGFDVDHRDRDPLNNKWQNLRQATRSQNNANSKLQERNKSGCKGVERRDKKKPWHARIVVDRKTIHLGDHSTYEEAVAVRKAAEQLYYGEFASTM